MSHKLVWVDIKLWDLSFSSPRTSKRLFFTRWFTTKLCINQARRQKMIGSKVHKSREADTRVSMRGEEQGRKWKGRYRSLCRGERQMRFWLQFSSRNWQIRFIGKATPTWKNEPISFVGVDIFTFLFCFSYDLNWAGCFFKSRIESSGNFIKVHSHIKSVWYQIEVIIIELQYIWLNGFINIRKLIGSNEHNRKLLIYFDSLE